MEYKPLNKPTAVVRTVKRAAMVFTTLAVLASGCAGDGAAPKIEKSSYTVNSQKTNTKQSWRKTGEKNEAHILVQEDLVTVATPNGRRFDFIAGTNLTNSEVKSAVENGKVVFSITPQNSTKTVRIASEKDTVYILE